MLWRVSPSASDISNLWTLPPPRFKPVPCGAMVDESPDRAQALAKVRERAPIPAATGDPVDDLLSVARSWATAVRDAAGHRPDAALDEAVLPADVHIDDLDRRFGAEFRARAGAVSFAASKAGSAARWDERIEDVLTLLREMRRAEAYGLITFPTRLSADEVRRRTYLPLRLRESFESLLSELHLLGASLPKPVLIPKALADVEQQVFDALHGDALLAKDIAKRIGGSATVGTVHKTIYRIRKKGYSIEEIKGRGYYRLDAPPPGVPAKSILREEVQG